MSTAGTHHHHGIDYIEIPVRDLDAAKRFYGESFGWTFNAYGPGYAGFMDGRRGDMEAGGMRLEEKVAVGGALVILYSSDLEETLSRVRKAGGKITKEIFEFPGGRRFQFEDPSGLELAVWTPL
jgi:predicted enzyme related to lactoylglutathione lyase